VGKDIDLEVGIGRSVVFFVAQQIRGLHAKFAAGDHQVILLK